MEVRLRFDVYTAKDIPATTPSLHAAVKFWDIFVVAPMIFTHVLGCMCWSER